MPGLDRETMAARGGWDHVLQSIGDILTTPVGTRVMRREYGSDLPLLVGRPMTADNILAVYAATALAIAAWEPRFALTGVEIEDADRSGRLGLRISGVYEGDRVTGRVPVERA